MVNKEDEDEFMKQYMEACKEQIDRIAKNPELLGQTLKPFMQMSKQLIEDGGLGGAMQNSPLLGAALDIDVIGSQLEVYINYIIDNYKELVASYNANDKKIILLNKTSKKLRGWVKKLVEEIENK
ncbi:hypothetical protein BIY23_03315 [Wolbachia pipientis]|uniref:Uncharacterized protein n=1 Tax=Wolbachia pipientis TaxID=955 RepID=A0A1E7QJC8_WOLPI|nr:hypothetical protein [Wolbachia pipientis]OEY86565.1 hypothetical protein BIY23_03315 [Wolbachia pipientis]